MNTVEYALEQIKSGALPVDRNMSAYEITVLREIAEKKAKTMPGGVNENLVFAALGVAFDFGFWQGWKHCEVERPDIEDFDGDELPDKLITG